MPSGVSRVMKSKLQKSDLITEFSAGPNLDSSEPSTLAVSEEVILIKFPFMFMRGDSF